MEATFISAEEAAEYGEFKRSRREAEVALLLKKAVLDASRREIDRYVLKNACDTAKKLGLHAVLVSPVNVVAARKFLGGSPCVVACRVGGDGESLPPVKHDEAKRAVRQGAREVYLSPCYSALIGGNAAYLKREIKKVRRSLKNCALFVLLDDREFGEEDISLGTRAAAEAKADGVSVRGEAQLILRALTVGAGKLTVHCSGVENAAQFRTAVRAGAANACSRSCEEIAKELFSALREEAAQDFVGRARESGDPGNL